MWKAHPKNVGSGLGQALHSLGDLLRDAGRAAEAERAFRRAVEITRHCGRTHPGHVEIGDGLGRTLSDLGDLLGDAGRVAEAERAYRRAVEIYEALWKADPENIVIGRSLGLALSSLGTLLVTPAGRRRRSRPTAAPSRSPNRCGRLTPRTSRSAAAWAWRRPGRPAG